MAKTHTTGVRPQLDLPTGRLDPAHCVLRHVSRLARAVVATYDQALAPVGLTGHQFNLLMTLHRSGPCPVGELAQLTGMDGSTVPRAVAPMVDRRWIAVATGIDRRQRLLSVTGEGAAALAKALPVWKTLQAGLLDRLKEPSWKDLTPALKAVGDAAKAMRADV